MITRKNHDIVMHRYQGHNREANENIRTASPAELMSSLQRFLSGLQPSFIDRESMLPTKIASAPIMFNDSFNSSQHVPRSLQIEVTQTTLKVI